MDDLGTVLGVWAHPDDETYLSAGLMAHSARSGSRVVDVTATRGEGGSMDEERWPSETMGEVRARELERSLEVLGVAEHHFLGLPDIDMDTGLPEEGAANVLALMEEVRPDTVLTFGPEGMTGHEGHKSVSRWTTEAFRSRAKPGARLYYAVYTQEWADEFVPVMNGFDIFRPGTPPIHPRGDLAIAFVLPDELLDLKMRAIMEHESQVEALFEAFGEDFFRRAMHEESFRLAEAKEGG
jgi:LmbE family N-acetylglucosaminyl deacetylase